MESAASCNGLSLVPDKTYNCGPGLFRFQLNGAAGAKQIIWNFGEGEKTAPDSLYQYLFKTGKIDVQVKILWGNGSRCDTTFKQIVEIKALPIPLVKVPKNRLCNGPDTVRFTCLNVGYQSISWIIDGTNYFNSGNSVVHKFTTVGSKGLNIVYIDSFGCRGIAELKDTVHIYNKVEVNFGADKTSGCAPQQISITENVNLNGESIKQAFWNIQGQKPDTFFGLSLSLLDFKNPGEFEVSLNIETQNGCFFNHTKPKFIRIGDSLPIVLSKPKSFYCFNENVIISDLYNKNGGNFTWTYPSSAQVIGDSTKNYIVLKINKNGSYKVNLTYERNGCITQATMKDSVVIKQITAAFSSANNYHCQVPLKVSFTDESFATDTGEILYQWFFYKAGTTSIISTSNVKNPSITFDQLGEYDVKLIVKHKQAGCVDTITKKNFVRLDTIRPQLIISPKIACVNQWVNFINATQSSSFQSKDTFFWKLYSSDGNSILKQCDSTNFSYQFKNPGSYRVSLFAGNNSGCSIKKTIYDTVEIVVPKLNYFIIPPNVCNGKNVRLVGATTPVRAKFTHFWEIEKKNDSLSFTTNDSIISLTKMGIYDLKYAIQIGQGCRDSIIQKNALGINGIAAKIVLDTTNGCLPFDVNASYSDLVNFHSGNSSNTVTQVWRANPNYGVIFSDSLGINTKVTFTEVGAYVLTLHLINSTGCDSIIKSETIYAGVDANFTLNDYRICIGDEIVATTSSKLKPTTYFWQVSSDKVSLSSTNDSFTRITTNTEGKYFITLIAEKNGICFDTLSVGFEAIEVIANFETLDTLLTCAPVYAQFVSTSKNADRHIWNYGDGQQFVTTSPNSGHIYSVNSGWSDGFDVELLVENDEGCFDLIKKEDYVWVLGPVPRVELTNYKGCEPLQVQLLDKSKDAIRYIVDFGDNKAWDSTYLTESHIYNVSQLNKDTQSFVLRLFAYDSLGCIAEFEPFEKIELYRKPTIVFNIDSNVVCNPALVNFNDQSSGVVKRNWTLNLGSKTIYSDTATWQHTFDQVGSYPITLVDINYMNCKSQVDDTVIVHPEVLAKLEITDSACLNAKMNLQSLSISNATITNHYWQQSLAGNIVSNKNGKSVQIDFQIPGEYNIELISKNEFGCSDTINRTVFVANPAESPKPFIKYVSVSTSNQTELFAAQIANNRFFKYDIFYNGNVVKSTINNKDSTWNSLPLVISDNNAQCYLIQETDICGFKSNSKEHCPIILSTTSTQNYTNNLFWTGYKGWDRVLGYSVFKKSNNGKFELLVKLDSSQFSYIDSLLCPGVYSYKIEANNASGWISSSNICQQVPRYQKINKALNIKDIQVMNNQQLQVRWTNSDQVRHHQYFIEKWKVEGNKQVKITSLKTEQSIWLDTEVEPNSYSYIYKVYDVDICNEMGPEGNFGKSILLKGSYIEEKANLNWSEYLDWSDGINKQQILIEKSFKFELLKDLKSNSLTFSDEEIHTDIKGDYCYKVKAISNPLQQDTSISNTLCLFGQSKIYIPNTFTPNGDGKNDVFRPWMFFVQDIPLNKNQNYEFTIFNRWGEILFETDKIEQGWTGVYLDSPAPQGVYGYKIQVYGLDGMTYYKSGTVNLLR